MKPLSTNLLKLFAWVLGIFVLAKAVWVTIGLLWLPHVGLDEVTGAIPKPLYYRPKFASSLPPPPPPKKPTSIKSHKPSSSIGDIKLYGIYATDEVAVVALAYKGKKEVLRSGESVGGFTLIGAKSDRAIFEKEGKRYEVLLQQDKKSKTYTTIHSPSGELAQRTSAKGAPQGKIIDAGDTKIIERSLVEHYRKNFKEIQKNIGIIGVKKGDGFEGFKVVYIKPKSHFSQLGLQKGDVIKSVNGIALDSLQAAMDIYKQVDNIEAMTMVIERNNQEVELEYEIN